MHAAADARDLASAACGHRLDHAWPPGLALGEGLPGVPCANVHVVVAVNRPEGKVPVELAAEELVEGDGHDRAENRTDNEDPEAVPPDAGNDCGAQGTCWIYAARSVRD